MERQRLDRARLQYLAWRSAWLAVGRVAGGRGAPIRFTIVCPARTGSELLVSLLDSTPRVWCDGELLKDPCRFPVALADGFSVRAYQRHGAEAYGWKLLLTQLRAEEPHFGGARAWAEREVESGHRLVFLWRRNLLAQVLSLVYARQSDEWHVRHRSHRSTEELSSFVVDPQQILSLLAWADEELAWGRSVVEGLPFLEVVYEDDLWDADRHQTSADRILTGLGLPPSPVRSDLGRASPSRFLDRVDNADDLVRCLAPTRFAHLVDSTVGHLAPPPT